MRSDKKETTKHIGQRRLGLGFGEGNAFHLFSHEPNQGLINNIAFTESFSLTLTNYMRSKNSTILSALTDAVKNHISNLNYSQIEEIVSDILALTIPDILVGINITRLQKIMPTIICSISNQVKDVFVQQGLKPLDDEAGQRFLRSIITSKYELFSGENIEAELNEKLDEIKAKLTIGNLHLIDDEILAYLIPALLDRMDDKNLRIASYVIANQLESKYLRAIADRKYFFLEITAVSDKVIINNANKRSLQFFANSTHTRVHFRNTDYTLQHTHIHFEKDGEEKEYYIDDEKYDGEVHTVFEINHKDNPNKKRLMAIGFPLKIVIEENPKIKELLDAINQLEEVKLWRMAGKKSRLILNLQQLELDTNYQNLFMDTFEKAKSQNSLLFHSWASLRPSTYGFRAGLRFIVVPFAITMSQTQYEKLKEIFGEMNRNLNEEDKLDPIDRKAGFRKVRLNLSQSLKEKIMRLSNHNFLELTK